MDALDSVLETLEAYVKDHQSVVDSLVAMDHVPRYIVMMELKAIMRDVKKMAIKHQASVTFLDKVHQKMVGKPI